MLKISKSKKKFFKKIKYLTFISAFLFTSVLSYLPSSPLSQVKTAEAAPGTRVRTVEFFAGQYNGSATNQNVGTALTFTQQNVQIAESTVDVIDAYVEFSAEIGATTAATITEGLIYFDACNPTACTPTPAIIYNSAGLGTNSAEAQTIRLRADVSGEATLAAFTGGTFAFQVGYCFDGASGTDASTCNGTAAANIQAANAKLVMSYTYDDTSATQTNTVIYPVESNTTGPVGSKTAVQASCTVDSNCPTFSYNANIPEVTSQVSQFFHTQFQSGAGAASTTTDHTLIPQVNGSASGSTSYFEEALLSNGGAMNRLVSGLAGYANNSSQALELGVNGNTWVLGGENYVTYTYPNNAATKTKTIVMPVGEVQTVGSTTKSALVGSTVYFPEAGVNVEKAWFRVHTSVGGNTTAVNLDITTKVGDNAESGITSYAVAGASQGVSDDGYFIHMVPSADYTELEAATADTGKLVQMTADWATARGAVSGELVITYTYTSDTDGFNSTQRLFAGQTTAAGATTFSAASGEVDPYINAGSGTATILGVSLKMDGKDTSTTANQTVGANMTLSPNACSASNTSTTLTDTEITKVMLFKSITGVVTTSNSDTYTPCYSSSQASVFNGTVAITIMHDLRTTITVSGTVYQTNETTALAAKTVNLRINGTLAGTGSGGTGIEDSDGSGNFSFTAVSAVAGDTLTLYLDGETEKANTIIITNGTSAVTSIPLYDDRVVLRADNGATAITILDLVDYDDDQDSANMLFDAEDAAPDTLVVEDGAELHIYTGDTFTPGGTVTTSPSASSASVDGDVHIDGTGTLSMGTNALSVGGDFNNEGTFSKSTGQTTTFTATATGHTIVGGGENFDSLTFNGSGGGWTFSDANTVDVDLTVTAGTLTVGALALTVTGNTSVTDTLTITSATGTKAFNGNVTINNGGVWNNTAANVALTLPGSLQNDGTFNAGSGAHTFSGASKTIGGANSITLASLVPTSLTNNGTLIVTGVISGTSLTNGATGVLKMGATPTVTTLTATAVGNDVYYTNTATIKATTYDDLFIDTGSATVTSAAATVNGNLTVTSGTTFSFANSAFTVAGTSSISGALTNVTGNTLKTFTGLVTIASGGSVNLTTATVPTLSFGSGVTAESGSGSINFGTGTTTLTATQAFTSAGSMTFGALNINSGATLTNSVAGTLTLTSLTLASGAGGVVLPTGSTTTVGAISFAANATATNTTITMNGTANLNATSSNIIAPTSTGSSNITCAPSASGTFALSGAFTLNGNSTNVGDVTADMGSCTLQVGGLLTINGGSNATGDAHLISSTGTITALAGVTFGGTAGNNKFTTTGAGIVNLTGAWGGSGVLSLDSTTTFNTSGTTTLGSTMTGSGALPNLNVLNGTTTLGNVAITVNGATNITGSLASSSATGTKTFTGLVTVISGGVFDLNSFATVTSFGAGIVNNSDATNSFRTGSGTATLVGNLSGSGTGGFNFPGALTISSGTTTNNYTAGLVTVTGTFTFTGGWTQAASTSLKIMGGTAGAGVLDASANTNTVEYGASGTQTAKPATYENLTISGTSAKTFATTPTVEGILLIQGTATIVATAGVVTYGSIATLKYDTGTSRTVTSEEWITPFNATGGVIIANNGIITLNEAKVFGTGAPLTVESGANFETGVTNLQLTFGGDFVNNGATLYFYDSPIVITSTATQAIGAFTTGGLVSMTKTSGTATFGGNIIGGGLTINGSGGTLNLGTARTHTFTGDVTLTAGTLNGGSSTLNLSNTSATVWNGTGSVFSPGTSTVNFSGANQTLAASATTFNNLTFSGSGTKTFTSATIINGDFTNNSGQAYATWNPSDVSASITLSNGNLTETGDNAGYGFVRATQGKSSGKWYWELFVNESTHAYPGIISITPNVDAGTLGRTAAQPDGWSISEFQTKWNNDTGTAYGNSDFVDGNTIGVALDMDAGTIEYFINNVSQGVAFTGLTGTLYPAAGTFGSIGALTANFGATPFTYTPPVGYNSGIYTGGTVTINTGNQDITLKGNFVNNSTALDAGRSNIILDGTATQAIAGFTTLGTVSMTKASGTATLGSALNAGALTINGTNGTLNLGTGLTHIISGATTLTDGNLDFGTSTVTTANVSSSNSNSRSLTLNNNTLTITGATYATWDPTDKSTHVTLSNGNLTAAGDGTSGGVKATIGKSSGKWYWETTIDTVGYHQLGVGNASANVQADMGGDTNSWAMWQDDGNMVYNGGSVGNNGASSNTNVIGMALDMDAGTLSFYRNNTLLGTSFSGITGTVYPMYNGSTLTSTTTTNFGATAFAYTPPTNYVGLSVGSNTSAWDASTSDNLTITPSTSTIKLTKSSSEAKIFAGGGKTYNNIWFAPGTGTGSYSISGNNTFNEFKDDGTIAHSLLFKAGDTQHLTSWNVSGSSGQLKTINSGDGVGGTSTSTHTLYIDGSGAVNADYLNIQHSIASPEGRWFAGDNSTNNQATATAGSGWFFKLESIYRGGGGGSGGEIQSGSGTCTDGIQNGDESGIDTGGRCAALSGTCSDGIQNGNETGVDTGGRCGSGGGGGGDSGSGTCTDGIQNGDETGQDTGGRCAALSGTCSDGIQNGNETGVDTGGRCGSGGGGDTGFLYRKRMLASVGHFDLSNLRNYFSVIFRF